MHRMQPRSPMAVEPAGSFLSSAGAREAGRMLSSGVAVLHPEETVFETSLAGWSMQMEARNLKPEWIAQSLRAVRRFFAYTNEYPWSWDAAGPRRMVIPPAGGAPAGGPDGAGAPEPRRALPRLPARPRLRLGQRLRALLRDPPRAGVLRVEHRDARPRGRTTTREPSHDQGRARFLFLLLRRPGRAGGHQPAQGGALGRPGCRRVQDAVRVRVAPA